MEHITKSAAETQKLGEEVGNNLARGKVIALSGELGSGKTTFVQGLAKGLGIKDRIISPTFIIVRKYVIGNKENSVQDLYHVDLYRLEGNLEGEIQNLGLSDIWNNQENVVVIEWAEKIRDFLPEGTTWINFENMGGEERRIKIHE